MPQADHDHEPKRGQGQSRIFKRTTVRFAPDAEILIEEFSERHGLSDNAAINALIRYGGEYIRAGRAQDVTWADMSSAARKLDLMLDDCQQLRHATHNALSALFTNTKDVTAARQEASRMLGETVARITQVTSDYHRAQAYRLVEAEASRFGLSVPPLGATLLPVRAEGNDVSTKVLRPPLNFWRDRVDDNGKKVR